MRIVMASDHAGFGLKQEIGRWLSEQGHEVLDVGTHDEQACDLPDYVYPGALALARGEVDRATSTKAASAIAMRRVRIAVRPMSPSMVPRSPGRDGIRRVPLS